MDSLLDLAGRYGLRGWSLFATEDCDAVPLARYRSDLMSTCCHLSGRSGETASDKRSSYRSASGSVVAYPRNWFPQGEDEIHRLDCEFAVISKPAAKPDFNAFTRTKAWRANSGRELIDRYRAAKALARPDLTLVLEFVAGGGEAQFSYGALCDDGVAFATLVACRCRHYPVDFGRSSSCLETVAQPEIEKAARRLLPSLRFTGLIEVEFKRDPPDGQTKLVDLIPRVLHWIMLGQSSGVDFPYLSFRSSRRDCIAPGDRERWVRMLSDVAAAAKEIRRGRLFSSGVCRLTSRPARTGSDLLSTIRLPR